MNSGSGPVTYGGTLKPTLVTVSLGEIETQPQRLDHVDSHSDTVSFRFGVDLHTRLGVLDTDRLRLRGPEKSVSVSG